MSQIATNPPSAEAEQNADAYYTLGHLLAAIANSTHLPDPALQYIEKIAARIDNPSTRKRLYVGLHACDLISEQTLDALMALPGMREA